MKHIAVKSSTIRSVGYCYETGRMQLTFKNKAGIAISTYEYENVDRLLLVQMLFSDSVGSFFGKRIKPFQDDYPFHRLESIVTENEVAA